MKIISKAAGDSLVGDLWIKILQLLHHGISSCVSTIVSWPRMLSYSTVYFLLTNSFKVIGLYTVTDILSDLFWADQAFVFEYIAILEYKDTPCCGS
jgi:hypothetical protein